MVRIGVLANGDDATENIGTLDHWRALMRVNYEDYRRAARRRLPRAVFDFIESGAGREITARANEEAIQSIRFRPRQLVDVSERSMRCTVLGRTLEMPIVLGPAGSTRLVHRDGELAVARAAARMGIAYALSTGGSSSIEEVAAAGEGAALWYQVYMWRGRELIRSMVDRAADSGYHAVILTVDTPTSAIRDRDLRNGLLASPRRPRTSKGRARLSVFPRISPRGVVDGIRHPRWLVRHYLLAPPITFKNVTAEDMKYASTSWSGPGEIQKRMSEAATWDEVRWLRGVWDGPLIVKGIMTPEDALHAFDSGADCAVVSNHGGRHLDGLPATIDVLPAVVEAAEKRGKEVLIDGGFRRGEDVVKALALGARAALVVRPYHWALAVGGEAGVVDMLEIMRKGIDSALGHLGRPNIGDLDRSAIEMGRYS